MLKRFVSINLVTLDEGLRKGRWCFGWDRLLEKASLDIV